MFKITTEGLKTLAEAFKSYEEGMQIKDRRDEERLTKHLVEENRGHVRESVNQEPALQQVDDARKGQLTKLVEALLAEENRHLVGPIRFARNKVKSVVLRLRAKH